MMQPIDIPNKKSKSIFPHLLLIMGGVLLFIENVGFKIGGSFIIMLGLFVTISKTGFCIDLEKKLYRQYLRFTVFNFGKWEPLPEIDYVALVRVRMSRLKFRPSEITFKQDNDSFEVAYDVNLIFKNSSKRYQKIFNGELIEAKEKTIQLAKALNLKIYDCSTSQKKWFDLADFR